MKQDFLTYAQNEYTWQFRIAADVLRSDRRNCLLSPDVRARWTETYDTYAMRLVFVRELRKRQDMNLEKLQWAHAYHSASQMQESYTTKDFARMLVAGFPPIKHMDTIGIINDMIWFQDGKLWGEYEHIEAYHNTLLLFHESEFAMALPPLKG